MGLKVAINGFGRIGRCVVRAAQRMGADVKLMPSLSMGRIYGFLLKRIRRSFPGRI